MLLKRLGSRTLLNRSLHRQQVRVFRLVFCLDLPQYLGHTSRTCKFECQDGYADIEITTAETEEASTTIATDPTIAHATLTEMEAEGEAEPSSNPYHVDTPTVPDASSIDAGAANAAAETNWDVKVSAGTENGPDGWVEIPRDPAETETGNQATPAALSNTQSWAEDVPSETPPAYTGTPDTPTANGDGFHEVHHGRGRGRGEPRGGGRGGRGRGGEGYRGRGGNRGDRGGGEGGHRGRGRGRGSRGRGDGSQ